MSVVLQYQCHGIALVLVPSCQNYDWCHILPLELSPLITIRVARVWNSWFGEARGLVFRLSGRRRVKTIQQWVPPCLVACTICVALFAPIHNCIGGMVGHIRALWLGFHAIHTRRHSISWHWQLCQVFTFSHIIIRSGHTNYIYVYIYFPKESLLILLTWKWQKPPHLRSGFWEIEYIPSAKIHTKIKYCGFHTNVYSSFVMLQYESSCQGMYHNDGTQFVVLLYKCSKMFLVSWLCAREGPWLINLKWTCIFIINGKSPQPTKNLVHV